MFSFYVSLQINKERPKSKLAFEHHLVFQIKLYLLIGDHQNGNY